MLLCYGYWCVNVGTFEAGNVGFKANFKYTNKHKGDVQRQLLLSIQRHRALESLYDTESYSGTKRKRHSYLESVEPTTRTNLDGSVDMLLNISVAPTTYKSLPVKYSATLVRNEVNVPTDVILGCAAVVTVPAVVALLAVAAIVALLAVPAVVANPAVVA